MTQRNLPVLEGWAAEVTGLPAIGTTEAFASQPAPAVVPAKASKAGVLYVHTRASGNGYQTQYQCVDCPHFIADKFQCAIHSVADVIQAYGTCGYWVCGAPQLSTAGAMPRGNVTKEQSGYEENPAGFSCKRCVAFIPVSDSTGALLDRGGCRLVDPESCGDDPGNIHPDACCAAWSANTRVSRSLASEFRRTKNKGEGEQDA